MSTAAVWRTEYDTRCGCSTRFADWSADVVFRIKITGDELAEGRLDQDAMKEICPRIDERGLVDYFHVCLGTRVSSYNLMIPEMSSPAGFVVYLAARVRGGVKVPVVAIKRIHDPVLAEGVLAEGQADVIGMTRALNVDPELPNKACHDGLDEIRESTASNQEGARRAHAHIELPIRRIHNPCGGHRGHARPRTLKRVTQPKTVAVIGGGRGGMRAAKVAA